MSEERFKASWRCPACGRENRATATLCSLCLAARPGATGIAAEPRPNRPSPGLDEDYSPPRRISPLWRPSPAHTAGCLIFACLLLIPLYFFGLGLLLVLTPALRYLFRMDRERGRRPFLPRFWCAGLLGIAIAALVAVSSVITCVAVCAPTVITYADGGPVLGSYPYQTLVWVAGLAAGLLAAGGVAYGLVRLFFRTVKRERGPWEPPGGDIRP